MLAVLCFSLSPSSAHTSFTLIGRRLVWARERRKRTKDETASTRNVKEKVARVGPSISFPFPSSFQPCGEGKE